MPILPNLLNPQEGIVTFPIKLFRGDHAIGKQNMSRAVQIFSNGPHDNLLQQITVHGLWYRVSVKVNLVRCPEVLDMVDGGLGELYSYCCNGAKILACLALLFNPLIYSKHRLTHLKPQVIPLDALPETMQHLLILHRAEKDRVSYHCGGDNDRGPLGVVFHWLSRHL